MRTFIGLPVSEKVKMEVERTQNELIKTNPRAGITWVKPEAMHVTLQFLGDLTPEKMERVKKVLDKTVSKHAKFSYCLNGLDAFPNKFNPNIIVAKIGEERQASFLLQKEIANELKPEGPIYTILESYQLNHG